MNLGKLVGDLVKKINPLALGGAVTKEASRPVLMERWRALPAPERQRITAEVRDLAGDMELADGLTVAEIDKRIKRLQEMKAAGGRPADLNESARQVADSCWDIIDELADGTDK